MHKRLIANWICFIVLIAIVTQPLSVYATPTAQSGAGNLQFSKAKKVTVLTWEEYEVDNETKHFDAVAFLTTDFRYAIYYEPLFPVTPVVSHQVSHNFQYRPLWLVHRILRL